MRLAPLIAAALLVSACAGADTIVATSEQSALLRGTIEIIDPVTRQVLVRADDGRPVTVTVPADSPNFDQLRAGDRVGAIFVESIAARMATPEDARETTVGVAAGRAPAGETPGAAAGAALSSVVTWVSYEPTTAIATFTGPTGLIHSVEVPPEMRAFAAARRTGDQVAIDYSEALAIGVEKIPG